MSAFALDQMDMYKELGHDKIVELSTAFYNRVPPRVPFTPRRGAGWTVV